jgi:decaprenylphospho-beta-D-ribofuranose 2-oxidase
MPKRNPAPVTEPEVATLRSFDGGVTERAAFLRPDRYRMIEADLGQRPRIARGGGYSYAAASFGGGSLVLETRRFNRLLRFEPEARLIEVEAGLTLEDLLALTAPRGLWLPVQPGYPAITIGGCIAANVHGKNPCREGTFRRSVVDLTLFHPRLGSVRINHEAQPELFDLTCGGYGLTGVILAATLRLEPLPGWVASVERVPIATLAEGLKQIRHRTERSAFAYTWHQGTPKNGVFGRGLVYEGAIPTGPPPHDGALPRYRRLNPSNRARFVVPLWGRLTTRLLGSGFRAVETMRPARSEQPVFDMLFPFARRGEYFLLYGRRGLAEYQALVPHASVDEFLRGLEHEALRVRPPVVMMSMKLFRGEQRLLRFEGDGVCVTVNLVRSGDGVGFLTVLDRLTLAAGGIPHIVKDSRLPAAVAGQSYPDYEAFRERLRAHDPERLFRSDLSVRLGL